MNVNAPQAARGDEDPRGEAFIERLSGLLREQGLIDDLALERARRAQRQTNERFDLVLTRLGLIPDAALAGALSRLLGLPLIAARDLPETPLLRDALPLPFLKSARLVPVREEANRILVATADPFNVQARDGLAFLLGRPVDVAVAAGGDIDAAIDRLYGAGTAASRAETQAPPAAAEDAGEDDVRRLEDMASEAPVIRLVHDLIVKAVEGQASDIHIEPRADSIRVRLRIDGVLHTVETLPLSLRAAISSRVKIMARLNIAERRLPQDGRIKVTVRGREIDLRVSTMPTMLGESVVLRILDRSAVALDFDALGFSGPSLDTLKALLAEPNGIILVTGPTGSGKTTTLYTALGLLNDTARKLFTVEDPIEYQIADVNQIHVNPKIGLTFASALRSILRQDPDVVMVGEIRDLETAEIAIRASLTGHLVLSTVHTNSAAATITRLIEMGVEDYLLASSLKGVLAQRLVRRVCSACAARANLGPAYVSRLAGLARLPETPDIGAEIRAPVGCKTCRGTGYAGRTTIYELLCVSDSVRSAVVTRKSEREIEEIAAGEGMLTMLECGLRKVFAGETTPDEVLRVTRIGDGPL